MGLNVLALRFGNRREECCTRSVYARCLGSRNPVQVASIFQSYTEAFLSFYDNRPAGKILVIINDVNSLSNLLTNGIVNNGGCCHIFIVLGLMLSMDVRLT